MKRFTQFVTAGLAVLALGQAPQADARQLSPGDSVTYEITTPSGEVKRPVVTFVSKREQRDSAGQIVLRGPSGSRTLNKDWQYTPHDGEFPDRGTLKRGDRWSFAIETWRDPAQRFRHVRTCEVTDQSGFRTTEYAFSGALKVDCSFTYPEGGEFRTSSSWYWRDDAGYYLLLKSVQSDVESGTITVKIRKITSADF